MLNQMQATQTLVDSGLRETTSHGTEGFPIGVYLDDFSNFEKGYICWHWHEEVQMTLILEGEMECHIENQVVCLTPGDIIFINSGLLHQIRPKKAFSGQLHSFIWRAEMIGGNRKSDIYRLYVEPVLEQNFKFMLFRKMDDNRILDLLKQIYELYGEKRDAYQLEISVLLSQLWLVLYQKMPEGKSRISPQKLRDEQRVKSAIQYMQNHYQNLLSLEQIAEAVLLSKSELCRCFRRTLDLTPMEYLIQYRIRQAAILLKKPQVRILDVSENVGFNSPSHFGQFFRKYMGCTPKEYRMKE